MIEFTLSFVNTSAYDLELANAVHKAIINQITRKKFLIGYHKGIESGFSGSLISFKFKGVAATTSLHEYLFNQFNQFLINAGVRDVVFISETGFNPLEGDEIYNLDAAVKSVSSNETMLRTLLLRDTEIPAEFKCHISGQVMDSPVSLRQNPGVYYNKAHLKLHLFTKPTHQQLNPVTQSKVDPVKDVVKDANLKLRIRDFIAQKIKEKANSRAAELQSVLNKYCPDGQATIARLNAVLRVCAASNDLNAARLLLSTVKPDINDCDTRPDSRRTALHYAISAGHTEMTRLLIDHQARIDIKDALGKTPIIYALESGQPDLIKAVMPDVDVSKVLQSVASMKI